MRLLDGVVSEALEHLGTPADPDAGGRQLSTLSEQLDSPTSPTASKGTRRTLLRDAIYTQSGPFQHLKEATGKAKAIENLSRYPDWTVQVCKVPVGA